MGLLEPLLLTAMLLIAVSAMASVFNSISRMMVLTQQQVIMQAAIDANLSQIKTLARQYTCCSGTCTTNAPSDFWQKDGVAQSCATNDPRDGRYYFPQADDLTTTTNIGVTSTSSEPDAVTELCQSKNNSAFMNPLKLAVDNIPFASQTTYATREATYSASNVHALRVTYTDLKNKVVRVENIIPKMAYFCP